MKYTITTDQAIFFLNEMWKNCIQRSMADAYDDSLRDQKGEALMMAINALLEMKRSQEKIKEMLG